MMTKKCDNIIETYDPVVYPVKVVIAIGKRLEDTINKRYRTPDKDFENCIIVYPEDCDACTYFLKDRRTEGFVSLIWAEEPNWFTISKWAHEASHAALDIFKQIHAEVDKDNQEPFAYLVGAITKMIDSTFYRFKASEKSS